MWNKAEKAAMVASKMVVGLNNKELTGNAAYVLGEVNLVNGKFKEALRGADESIAIYQGIDHKAMRAPHSSEGADSQVPRPHGAVPHRGPEQSSGKAGGELPSQRR
eukprot:2924350-Heterocapsa_arctica.AAC.1